MNTKRCEISQHYLNVIIATRLGLEDELVKDVINMLEKTVVEHLKRGYPTKIGEILTLTPKYTTPYQFKSGLDAKKYGVGSKFRLIITFDKSIKEQIKERSESILLNQTKS